MQKIVAVLNDFDKADLILGRAVRWAKEQNAALEILFVHEAPLFTLPDFFHHRENKTLDKTKIREELQERVEKLGYDAACAIFVFVDDTADRVAAHTDGERDTLVVAAYHKSLSEELVEKCYPPLMVLKNDRRTTEKISLPIELDEETKNCIEMTRSLFVQSSIHLIYDNHYLTDKEENEARKKRFEALKEETGLEGSYIEEFAWNEADFGEDFDVVEEHLLAQIKKDGSDLTVLCSREGDFPYSIGVTLSLLHKAASDFFIFRYL